MEDGRLTDSQGRRVDFKNTVIVMTSNVGAKNITERKKLGFSFSDGEADNYQEIKSDVMADLRRTFRPEFLNRVDEIIVFHQLSREDIKKISRSMLDTVSKRLSGLGVSLEVDESAVEFIANIGYDPVYGARPLRRAIQQRVEDAVAEKLLDGSVKEGQSVKVSAQDDKIVFATSSPV
jgi:ATP-dependent Clp protease ATP-binding subunit ClpC